MALHTSVRDGINNPIRVITASAYGFRDNAYFFLKTRPHFQERRMRQVLSLTVHFAEAIRTASRVSSVVGRFSSHPPLAGFEVIIEGLRQGRSEGGAVPKSAAAQAALRNA